MLIKACNIKGDYSCKQCSHIEVCSLKSKYEEVASKIVEMNKANDFKVSISCVHFTAVKMTREQAE